jgi:carboxyl-terminal processing protease
MLGFTLVVGLGGGYFGALKLTNPCPESADVCARFNNFWKAWDLASSNYVDPAAIDSRKMTDGAIEGMLDSLGDQGHTVYLSPESARAEREALSGRFEGIGAYVLVRDNQLYLDPIEGSPAERSGVRSGDIVLKVNGEDVSSLNQAELVNKVRGPKGTKVTLTIQHQGETQPVDIDIERDEINVPSVSWRMLSNKVALVHLNRFAERSTDEMKQALTDAQAQGATSIVLDLRNNPGGYVSELEGVASQFLPAGTTVLLEQERSGERKPHTTKEGGAALTIPLVVLVNNNSASSAEILAAALKEAGRARVIGVPTFGTATVLRTFDLNDGAQVRIGTTQWLTPKGEVVRGKGIQPDEIVTLPADVEPLSPTDAAQLDAQALFQSKDVQLVRALQVLKEVAKK